MTTRKLTVLSLILSALLAFLLVGGCQTLTPGQAQTAAQLDQQIIETQSRMDSYSAEILKVKAAIESGQTPVAEGTVLLSKLIGNYQADLAQLKELTAAYNAAKNEGLPWYHIALLIASGLTGAGAVYFPLLKPAQTIIRAIIAGVESAGNAETKEAISTIAKGMKVEPQLNAIVEAAYPSPSSEPRK